MAGTSDDLSTVSTRSSKQATLSSIASSPCPPKRRKHVKIEYEENRNKHVSNKDERHQISITEEEKVSSNIDIKQSFISPKKKINQIKDKVDSKNNISKSNDHSNWRPNNWEMLYSNIKMMRADRTAIVDSQGCERTADPHATPQVIRYQTLVSLMISSQTKDEVTFEVMAGLKKHGLTISNIIRTSEDKLGEIINRVGFWKSKVKYIKEATLICHKDYKDDIPSTFKDLRSLPGVGQKMAHICMHDAWGETTGIGVDNHTHRISNWLGFIRNPTKTPENTRRELESWLPRSEWQNFNILLVGFGQQTCLQHRPKCHNCLNKEICPATQSKYVPPKVLMPKKEKTPKKDTVMNIES